MTEPIQTLGQVTAKFPNEELPRSAYYVEIYPSGLMYVEWEGPNSDGKWYPPDSAPTVKNE